MTKEEYREMRSQSGLSMEKLAAKLGIAWRTIWRREKGENAITLEAELAIKEIVRREKAIQKKEKAE